jgi:hypothetical protein
MESLRETAVLIGWYVFLVCASYAAGYFGGKLIFVNPSKRKPVNFIDLIEKARKGDN